MKNDAEMNWKRRIDDAMLDLCVHPKGIQGALREAERRLHRLQQRGYIDSYSVKHVTSRIAEHIDQLCADAYRNDDRYSTTCLFFCKGI